MSTEWTSSATRLRLTATMLHAIPGAAGRLSWPDGGPELVVGASQPGRLHPCHLRAVTSRAMREGPDVFFQCFGRRGEPTARLLAGPGVDDLGMGVYRVALPWRTMAVFATTLEAEAARQALRAAVTLDRGLVARGEAWVGAGLDSGLLADELTAVSLVWLGLPRSSDAATEASVLDVALSMAGACAAAEADRWLDRIDQGG